MDIRENAHDQLVAHVATIRFLATQETPAPLIWEEMQRYLDESARALELFVIPKVEAVKQHLDILGRNGAPIIAEYVAATSPIDEHNPLVLTDEPGRFLGNGRGVAK